MQGSKLLRSSRFADFGLTHHCSSISQEMESKQCTPDAVPVSVAAHSFKLQL